MSCLRYFVIVTESWLAQLGKMAIRITVKITEKVKLF
jgi:hypothetical protein